MKGKLIVCLLIGILTIELCLGATEKSKVEKNEKTEVTNSPSSSSSSSSSTTVTKSQKINEKQTKDSQQDKRQVDHQTSINPHDQNDSIFRSPNHFVIRAVGYNNRIGSRRIHTNGVNNNIQQQQQQQQLQQQFHSQSLAREHQIQTAQANQAELQSPEDALVQQYGYYHEVQQPTHRFQQYRPLTEQFKPLLQKSYHPRLAQYIPQAQQLIQPQPLLQAQPSQNPQDIPQYAPHPYPIVQEDQLLKFLEDELANKGITTAPQPTHQNQHVQHIPQSILLQKKPQPQQQSSLSQHQPQTKHSTQTHTQKSEIKYKPAGLGSYKQPTQQQENIQYVYIPQHQEQQAHQQHQIAQHQVHQQPIPQQLIETPPPPQYFIQQQEAAPITYQPKPTNKQILQQQQASYEKEYEKLYPVSKQNSQVENQPQYGLVQPQPQTYKAPIKLHSKPQPASDKEYSFLPSLAQFSGFAHQAKSTKPQAEKLQSSRQYLPKVNYNHGQYLIETQTPAKQSKIKTSINPGLSNNLAYHNNPQLINPKPQSTSIQYYTTSPQKYKSQNQFIPIVHSQVSGNKKENAMKLIEAPALQYEKPEQQQIYYKGPIAQHSEQVVTPAAPPSVSTIYVSQATGIEPTQRPIKQGHHSNSHTIKDHKNEKRPDIKLPPSDGKPITQEEFQALVDAGYPVQAVPIPVPVPYEEYIKTHPEYEQEVKRAESQRHHHEQSQQEHQQRQQQLQQQHQQQQQQLQQHQQQQHQHHHTQQQEASETNIYNTQESGVTYLRQLPQRQRRNNSESTVKN